MVGACGKESCLANSLTRPVRMNGWLDVVHDPLYMTMLEDNLI